MGQIVLMNKCCLIWLGIGSAAPQMADLSVSMLTPQSVHPLSSTLIESGEGDASAIGQSISRGVAKKFGVQCFVSYNLPSKHDENLLEIMEPILSAYEKAAAATTS